MGERAPRDAITYAWGLTEAQWHGRVQSAESRALAAESALTQAQAALPDPEKLETIAVWLDAWDRRIRRALDETEGAGEATENDQALRDLLGSEMQDDLRRWATAARAALASVPDTTEEDA